MYICKVLIFLFLWIPTLSFSTDSVFEQPTNLYNKSLDYYQQKDFGNAMYHIKKALLLTPYNHTIRSLFYTIRKDLGLPVILSSDTKYNKILSSLLYRTPPRINALWGSFSFILACIMISLIILHKIPHPYILYVQYLSILLMIYAATAMILSIIHTHSVLNTKERVVISACQMYEEPSIEGHLITTLSPGSELHIIDENDDFYLVKTLESKEGWIQKSQIVSLF